MGKNGSRGAIASAEPVPAAGALRLRQPATGQRIPPLARFIAVRILMLPVSVFVIISVSFFLMSLLPGDIARALLGPVASPAQIARVNARLGLDQPIFDRYRDYISGVAHGSLGSSYYTGRAIVRELSTRLPATIELVVPALLIAIMLGMALGSVGAYYSRRPPDAVARFGLTLVQSVPDFLLGLLLILVFFSWLNILPGPEGQLSFADSPPPHHTGMYVIDALLSGQGSVAASALRHLVLPALTLGVVYSATVGRTSRALLGNALAAEYTQFGRACGLSEIRLLRNAVLASRTGLLTYIAVLVASIIGGDAVVEIVFSWNGVGQYAVQSMLRQDLPAVEGFVVVVGTLTVVVYLLLDLVSALLDPRIRFDVSRRS
jgi:peptide/nickel transport system permease protein